MLVPGVKASPALQGPLPALFDARIHHIAAPAASAIPGDTLQIPVPALQPACAAV